MNGCNERHYGCKTHSIKKWFGSRIYKTATSHGCGKDAPKGKVAGEISTIKNEVGETTGESQSNLLSLTINQNHMNYGRKFENYQSAFR